MKFTNLTRALVIAGALAPIPALADTVATDQVVEVQHRATPRTATHEQGARYAERDQADKDAQTFQGGSAVIIASGGAVLLALLIVLLVI